jgi:N-acetylglucosamine malate deacetylase 1
MRRVFAIAAHPDDIEFLMAGTMLRLAAHGFELHYMTVADGCCGTTEYDRATIASIRRQESMAAAAAMGATFHEPLCDDLGIFYDRATLARLASIVRKVRPEIVLTHAPVDYMEDHTATCRLAVTASFARGMPNFPVDPPVPAYGDPVWLYHAQPYGNRTPLGDMVQPTLHVDTTDLIERKAELLALHASQRTWLDESQGLDSYCETLRSLDREVGSWTPSFRYAEGWRRHLPNGFGPADRDPLRETLGDACWASPEAT